ncbi:zinc finger protein 436-like [Drosophila miranda]|uniref:zinc finger protein 436-like n=1 Tax=Drosophila miranda TaxID=7229 RepID=UPI00143F0D38|nr:zinc finger protein 436-like [Drosophila miranda]
MDAGRPCLLCKDNLAVGIKLENEVIENSKELLEKLVVWYNIDPYILRKKSCICEPCLGHVLDMSATLRRWTAAQPKTAPSETFDITIKEESPLEIDGWENIELMPEQTLPVSSVLEEKKELLAIVSTKAATVKPSTENFAVAVRHDGLILAKFYRNNTTATTIICTCCNVELSLISHIRTHSLLSRVDPRYICRRCDKTFNCLKRLKDHEKTQQHNTIWSRSKGFHFRCVECGKVFDRYPGVVRHASIMHISNRFYCTFSKCSYSFDNKADLDKHLKSHEVPVYHASPLYVCHLPDCGQSYYLETNYNKHMKTFHGMYVCPHPGCGEALSLSSQAQHAQLHSKDQNGKKNPSKQGEFLTIENSFQRKRRYSYSPPNDNNRGHFISLPKPLTLK